MGGYRIGFRFIVYSIVRRRQNEESLSYIIKQNRIKTFEITMFNSAREPRELIVFLFVLANCESRIAAEKDED